MRRPGWHDISFMLYTFPLATLEAGISTYTRLVEALRFAGLVCRLSSLSDSATRFLAIVAADGNGFGESSTSISLVGVVGIDGLLKMETSAVEGVSDCGGEQNLALLRGGMGAVKGPEGDQE